MLGTGHQQHQRDQKQHRCFISSDAFVDDVTRPRRARAILRAVVSGVMTPASCGCRGTSEQERSRQHRMNVHQKCDAVCELQHMSKCRGRSDAVVVVLGAVPGG